MAIMVARVIVGFWKGRPESYDIRSVLGFNSVDPCLR